MRLGQYTKILERKDEAGLALPYRVTQTMRYARRRIDFEGEEESIEFDGTMRLPEGYGMAWRDPTGEDPGPPVTLERNPEAIEHLFRTVWAAGWLAAELHAPGDDELKKRLWGLLTANILVHGNLNMRALERTPLTSKRSHSTWRRLAKRAEAVLDEEWLNQAV
jgi:hypothetical protein